MSDYLKRMNAQTKTRIWINNSTPSYVTEAMGMGAFGATTNPTYVNKMLQNDEMKAETLALIDRYVKEYEDDHMVVTKTGMDLAKKLADICLPIWKETKGDFGWVAIQGCPYHDDDPDYMYKEALMYYDIAPNIVVKLPATTQALTVAEKLVSEGRQMIATAGLSVPHARSFLSVFKKCIEKTGKKPPLLCVTSLHGIFNQYAEAYVAANKVDIDKKVLAVAGTAMMKSAYQMWAKEFPGIGVLQGAGVRKLNDIEEVIGGDIHLTINREHMEPLEEKNAEIVHRIDEYPADDAAIAELDAKIPGFKAARGAEDLLPFDWKTFPPIMHFKSTFYLHWDAALAVVKERRSLFC